MATNSVARALPWLAAACAGLIAHAEVGDRPTGSAVRLDAPPTVDGDVAGDPAWQGLAPLTGFRQLQPDNGEPATERTEAFIGYTDHALYIGVICYEDDPAQITLASDGFGSDSFIAVFDPFRTGQRGFAFGTNPVAAEYDGQVAQGFVDWNWSTVWEVRATINEDSWSAELAIPFGSLRYGGEEVQSWGMNLARTIRRNNEVSYWAPMPRQLSMFRLDLAGTLQGLRVPPQRPRNLKLMPYLLGSMERRPRAGAQGDRRIEGEEFGFDLKYSITPSLTLDLTYNTDFAQVEADQQQVNFGRFSLFFPETRPFFLENADAFDFGVPGILQPFFSRRIGIGQDGRRLPIIGGARLSGKLGRATNIGFLHMRAEAGAPGEGRHALHNDYTVLRMSQDLRNRSSLGFIATNRDDGETDGQTYGVDGTLGIGQYGLIAAFAARTAAPGSHADDHTASIFAGYDSPTWSYNAAYTETGAGFDPQVGFVGRTGYRRLGTFVQRTYAVQDFLGLNEWKPHASYTGFWDFDGYYESGYLHIDNWMVWKNGADLWTAANFQYEGVRAPFPVAGNIIPAGEYDTSEFHMGVSSPQTGSWSGGTMILVGGFYNGDRRAVSPFVNYRRDERLSAWAGWDHNVIELPGSPAFDVNLARVGFSWAFTPKVRLQTLVQYNDADHILAGNLRFSWLRSANAGLYLVYNEVDDRRHAPGQSRREVVLKYSHIFDVF